jgi:heme exporter protein CcmD
MLDLGPHQAFILASYAASFSILGVMILGSWLEWRAARRRLGALEPVAPKHERFYENTTRQNTETEHGFNPIKTTTALERKDEGSP